MVTVRDDEGNTATGFTGPVTLSLGSNPSGGTLYPPSALTVNAVAGASRLPLRDLLLGTAVGLVPLILLTLIFVNRVRAALADPGPASYGLLAADTALIVAALLFVWRRFGAAPLSNV